MDVFRWLMKDEEIELPRWFLFFCVILAIDQASRLLIDLIGWAL
jgi:hypothetical protein